MVSLLESKIRSAVAAGLKGKLLTCTLRREVIGGLDDYGDPVAGSVSTWTFDGMRDTFTLQYAQAAGVSVTDTRLLVIRGSSGLSGALPLQQDDKVKVTQDSVDEWLQLRTRTAQDPAGATEEWAAFSIATPDGV